jgi:fibronectin-binding autotransporter adhesin
MSPYRLPVRHLLAIGLLTVAAGPAAAQTFTWNVTNGSFQSASSWTPVGGPPGVGIGVVANFAGPSSLTSYQATFDSDWALNNLTLNQGTTTFALTGHSLTVNAFSFGSNNSQTTTLNLTNGTFLTPGGSAADFATGTSATFNLNLDHVTFSSNSFTDMASGGGSTLNLMIRNGSTYSALNNSFVGIVGTAAVGVDGAGSSFTLGFASRIGSGTGSSGSVSVSNGGAFHTTGGLSIGANTGATGTVTLNNTGSSWTHADGLITVGGGTAGTLNINPGASMTVTGTAAAAGIMLNTGSTMNVAGTVTVGGGIGQNRITLNGGTLNLNAGAALTTDYLTRNTGVNVPTFNDGLLAVNKSFDLGTTAWTLTGNTAAANPTLQVQNGATANGITTLTIGNAVSRKGTLNVLSGSTATFLNTVSVGNVGAGTVLVDGAGSKLISTQAGGTALNIGNGGTGTVTVQNGGSYQGDPGSTNIILGQAAAGVGTLTISGVGSTVTTGGVSVGQAGSGAVNVLAGGTFAASRVQIGETVGGAGGTVNVSGIGSTLTSPSGLFIGGTNAAAGATGSQLVIANGGSVTAATTMGTQSIIYAGSTLTINGGTLTTGNLTRLGTLALNDGTLTINGGFLDAGSTATPLSVQGNAAGTLATLQILNGSTTSNIGTLAIGGTRPGAVVLGSGANVTPNAVTFATANTGGGSISLSGASTSLSVNTNMTFGATGANSLTIGTGSSVSIGGTLALGTSGTVNLNGGSLTLGTLGANGGMFNWASGTVAFPGTVTLGSTELTTLLGPGGTLSAGRTLKGSNFSGNPITFNANLTVTGGTVNSLDVTNNAVLTISAGTVGPANGLVNNAGGLVAIATGAVLGGGAVNSGELQLGGGTARIAGTVLNAGRISGGGAIAGTLTNNANGTVTVDAGQRLVVNGFGTNNSNANITLNGGTLEYTGSMTNTANGLIAGRGTFNTSTASPGSAGISNFGVMAFSGGTTDVRGDVTNNGSGVITNSGGGILTFYDDMVTQGTIRTFPGSRTVFLGDQSGAGSFPGGGTVEYAGDVRPGNSPAQVVYGGDVALDNIAGLHFELGGHNPGSQYDQLAISGTAFIDGTLDVKLINGFAPQAGDRFDIMTFGSRSGDFATFAGLNVGNGLTLVPDITPGRYSLVVTPVPEPGSLLLAGAGLGGFGVGWWRRRRFRRAS